MQVFPLPLALSIVQSSRQRQGRHRRRWFGCVSLNGSCVAFLRACVFTLAASVVLYSLLTPVSMAADMQISPGSVEGSFDVGPLGSASYTIPIKCPPGTAGMAPKI